MNVKFSKYTVRPDGEPLYRLTIDQVVETINSRDELSLGDEHVKGGGLP